MLDHLWLDFESRSEIDLDTNGLDRYVRDPSTSILMLAYARNDEPVQLWEPHKTDFPIELEEALRGPFVKSAFNVSFERNIFKYVQKIDIAIEEWFDVMIQARHLSIAGNLERVCEVLGLGKSEAKIEDGKRLINMFCYPVCEARQDTLFGSEQAVFRDWTTDPEDWQKFCEYCKQDVIAERAIYKKIAKYPLPKIEQAGWVLDQKINERGVPVDLTLVQNALHISEQAKYTLNLRMKTLTGLDNPGSVKQLLTWAKKEGYPFNSMGKVWVERSLAGNTLSEECAEVFRLRQQAAKTSWAKLEAIQNIVSPDGRVRNQFSYLGSARAGRWAGRDIQLQNLPRPAFAIEKKMDLAVNLVREGEYDKIKREFPNEMDVVSSVIRAAFRAQDGEEFDIADLSAIENRTLGWMNRCEAILDVFRRGQNPYVSFAAKMFNKEYGEVTKDERQSGKAPVLGAGYRLSGGEESIDRFGNPIKTGLWGYAHSMGIPLSQGDSHLAVQVFREQYPEVVKGWFSLEDAAMSVIRGRPPIEACRCIFEMVGRVLVVRLPSGRCLHYINPKIENLEFFGKMKPTLTYDGQQLETKQWGTIRTHGGKLMENLDQAISRDILLHGMQLAEKEGIFIVAHVHDEIISLRGGKPRLKDLIACMSVVPAWAPGLILGAEGFSSQYYKKN